MQIGRKSVRFSDITKVTNYETRVLTTFFLFNLSANNCRITLHNICRFFAIVPPVQQLRFHLWLKKWLKKLGHKVYIGVSSFFVFALKVFFEFKIQNSAEVKKLKKLLKFKT